MVELHSSVQSTSAMLPMSIACPVYPKEEGGHDPALCALNPQQPHSISSMSKEEKYRKEQLKALISHRSLYTLHSICSEKDDRATKTSICSLKHSNCISDPY